MYDPSDDRGGGPAWTLPLYLARCAWAGLSYDLVLDRVLATGGAHLVHVTGEPPAGLTAAEVATGPAAVLPVLTATLRRGAGHPAPEVLSLITASPGDVSSVPAVRGLVDEVVAAGCATLIRDPATGAGIAVAAVPAGPEVMRWTVRGIVSCPVAPQPAGIARASAELSAAVLEAADLVSSATAGPGVPGRPLDLERRVTRLPPGLPERVVDLVDRADHVEAIVRMATSHRSEGNAIAEREPILHRLRSAVDAARRAAVAETARDALEASGSVGRR